MLDKSEQAPMTAGVPQGPIPTDSIQHLLPLVHILENNKIPYLIIEIYIIIIPDGYGPIKLQNNAMCQNCL